MTSKLLSVLVASAATLVATTAAAHVDLMSPISRSDNDPNSQKTGPCEGMGAGTRTELTAGETFTVEWNETIQHPGHFRIAIDEDGEDFNAPDNQADFDGLDGMLLVETEADTDGEGYSHDITVPNVNCDNCTLQVVQVMVDGDPIDPAEDYYFRCADISIVGATGDGGAGGGSGSGNGGSSSSGEGGSGNGSGASSGAGAGSDGGSGSGNGSGAGAPANPGGNSGETHDCAVRAVGASSPTSSLAMALGLGAIASLAAARRRRRG